MKRNLRRLVRLLVVLAVLTIVAAGLFVWWLPGYAEREALRRLEAAGFAPASGRLVELTPWAFGMEDLRLGEDAWVTVGKAQVAFSPTSLWRGDVDTVTLSNVSIARLTLDTLHADLSLAGWGSAGEHRVTATNLRFASAAVGDLESRISLPTPHELHVLRFQLAGSRLGELSMEPTTLDLADHTARVTLRVEGAELAEVLRLALGDDATGRGLLDGWLDASVHVTPPYRFLVRGGQLRARPEARVQVRNEQGLRDLLGASVTEPTVREELVAALRDFAASRVEVTLAPGVDSPLRIRLVGTGGPIHRPVDLTLNLRGVTDVGNTPLLDYLMELRNVE